MIESSHMPDHGSMANKQRSFGVPQFSAAYLRAGRPRDSNKLREKAECSQ